MRYEAEFEVSIEGLPPPALALVGLSVKRGCNYHREFKEEFRT